jgi:glutaredoxin 3
MSIQIYTTSRCPYCLLAKNLLKGKGIDFVEVNLDGKDRELVELRERTGHRTVPQIFINGKMIGGYQDLAALDMRGELERIVNP